MTASLVIDHRFCGPPGIANGGYVAGLLAEQLPGSPVEVTLWRPTPLGTKLQVDPGAETIGLCLAGAGRVAEARRAARFECRPPVISWAAVLATEALPYAGADGFGCCFACGPEVASEHSLGVFPRPLADGRAVACRWRPPAWAGDGRGKTRERFVWAALDCSGGFAIDLGEPVGMVLTGRLTTEVLRSPGVGEECAVLGWRVGSEGRKHFVRSAVLSKEGGVLAHTLAVWLKVDDNPG
ncbi:MAG: hypothetical protein NVS9B1_14200 [Candidatus Dormibacteraceae bacterium]